MRYNVNFMFGGCVTVVAESKEEAEELVGDMCDTELLRFADLEIQSVEEVTE